MLVTHVLRGRAQPDLGLGLALAACVTACVLGPGCHDGHAPTPAGETETGDESSSGSEGGGIAPEIVAAPAAVARGSRLYVVVDTPLFELELELAGRVLEGVREPLFADLPGALVRIPDDLPVGPTMLVVRRRDDPAARAEHALEIVIPRFVDVATGSGLAQRHDVTGSPPECAESHTGLAFGDYDADGAPDVFMGHVGEGGRLHRNVGDRDGDGVPEFEDVTAAAGLAGVDAVSMAMFVDLEGDGDLDLFVGRRGANRVFRNRLVPDGVASFEDVTLALGLGDDEQRTMGVAFGDYDGDEDLDLYVVNHAFCFPRPGSEIRARDHLYRNDGGVFVERTHDLTLLDPDDPLIDSVGFSAVWVDVERDGDQDLVVINDDVGGRIGSPNALWRNDGPAADGGWTFTDVSTASGVGLAGVNGMGLAIGDVNHDGFVDLAFSNIGDNVLLLNAGDGTFENVSAQAGITRGSLPWERQSITWAAHLFDHDDDGDLDLYFSGGRIKGMQPIPDAFFDNRGDGSFADMTWSSGLSDPGHGKGSALVDLDRDGAWELATVAWGEELRVYHNRVDRPHHWLDVELEGRGANRDGLGSIVEVRSELGTQTCFLTGRPSLGGGSETTCHFGLGTETEVLEVAITWPDGSISEPSPPPLDQRIRWVQP